MLSLATDCVCVLCGHQSKTRVKVKPDMEKISSIIFRDSILLNKIAFSVLLVYTADSYVSLLFVVCADIYSANISFNICTFRRKHHHYGCYNKLFQKLHQQKVTNTEYWTYSPQLWPWLLSIQFFYLYREKKEYPSTN